MASPTSQVAVYIHVCPKSHNVCSEDFVTWSNNSHLKLNISKTNVLVVDHQRNRSPPVLVVIQGEEVTRMDSYKYPEVKINKKLS